MGKFAPNPVPPQMVTPRTHSGRSYWVRNISAPAGDAEPAIPNPGNHEPPNPALISADSIRRNPGKGVPRPSAKKRFVEPYRLSEEQRVAMLAPLAERGLGDAESRDLFAAALAYDIATCYELTAAEPLIPEPPQEAPQTAAVVAPRSVPGKRRASPAARDQASTHPVMPSALAELAQAAKALTERIQALDPQTRIGLFQALHESDRFHRGYDDAYLAALGGELVRLAEGAAPTPAVAQTPEATSDTLEVTAPVTRKATIPKPSPAARQFIVRAADAFEECFDQSPTTQVGGPFAAMLKALAMATGIRIPTDARNLAEILRHA
jgi:hypothetical protein